MLEVHAESGNGRLGDEYSMFPVLEPFEQFRLLLCD